MKKLIITSIMCFLLMMPLAAMPSASAESSSTLAILIDYGNGQSVWADIDVNSSISAYDATQIMATNLGLVINATHFSFGWSINSVNGIGDNSSSGGYNLTSYEYWGFMVWNSTSNTWQTSSKGASQVWATNYSAVSWGYMPWGVSPLATPDHRTPWRSFRHDNFNNGLQSTTALNNVTLRWSENLQNGGIYAPIVAANGLAYAITGGVFNQDLNKYVTNSSVYCVNSTGGVVWSREIGAGWYQTTSPLIYDSKVIVSSANGLVYAFDAKTGVDAWAQPFDMETAMVYGAPSPIAYGGWIYVASGHGELFALMGDGTEAWNATVASAIYSSSPAAKGGVIYIGAEDGKLHTYNSMTGAQQWNVTVGNKIRGTPVLTGNGIAVTYVNYSGNTPINGGVAFVSYAGQVTSYAQTGITPSSPALTETGIVSATYEKMFMTTASGQILWNISLGSSSGLSSGAPAAVNGMIFMVVNEEHSRLIAVSEQGQIYWQKYLEPAQFALSPPTIADGILYAGGDDGWMHTFDLNMLAPPASANFSMVAHNLEATFSTTAGAGSLFEYNWAFGDSSHGTGMSPVHTYAVAGTYNVALTISNRAGQEMTVINPVTVHTFTAPRDFTATAGEGKVTLSWTAPLDNGGSDIISYEIFRAVQDGSPSLLATVPGSNHTYIDMAGTVGTNYTYNVVARNAEGAGPASASAIASPLATAAAPDNTLLYVGIVAVVLVIVVAAAMVMRGRKK
jgi:outer membrane protein assembly factor BamB